jgi:hypothetical protein
MLKYQIHKLSKGGIEARSVLLEDILTSDVFGLMFYFPYEFLLKPFLKHISVRNPNPNFSVPDANPINFYFWESINWPETFPKLGRKEIEPDVIIEWDDTLLFIEAKFGFRSDVYDMPKQLLRELLVGINQARGQKRFFLLLIDKNLSPPNVLSQDGSLRIPIPEYLEMKIKELNLSNEITTDVSHSFLWINWQTFYLLIKEFLKNKVSKSSKFDLMTERILNDLLEVLQKKGLVPFEKLELALFESKVVDPQYLGEIGVRIRKRYSDLSDVFVDLSVLDMNSYAKDMGDLVSLMSSINLAVNSLDFISANKKAG